MRSKGLEGAVAAALLLWASAPALAATVQVTTTPPGRSTGPPQINRTGRLLAFESTANHGGLNPIPIGNVFVYELGSGLFTRITSEGGFSPVISGDGRYVAFISSASYTGRNEDGSDELFRYDRSRRRFAQLTKDREGEGSSQLPSISGDGRRIAFESSSNLGRRNSDFSNEVFLRRGSNRPISVDREGDGESHAPAISADGRTVAFVSSSNLTGGNSDFSQELFIYNVSGRRLAGITYDPEGNGESSSPAVSGEGRFVAYVSSTNVGGQNPDNATAVWVRSRAGSTLVTTTPFGPFDADMPSIDEAGDWIALQSNYNITGGNPDSNSEILVYNRERRTFFQLTQSTGCSNELAKVSGDATRIAYHSNCNPTGGNPGAQREIFVADNPGISMVVHSEGPVGLVLSDPNSGVVTNGASTIPFATYEQGDFDGDTVPEVRITVPQAIEGRYLIRFVSLLGAAASDPVTVDGTLNGVTVELASSTVGALLGTELSLGNQTFTRRSSTIKPLVGLKSLLTLAARMPHPRATSGPVMVLFDNGGSRQTFNFPNVETYYRGLFKGTVDGFTTRIRVTQTRDGSTSLRLRAKYGDLSEFAGEENASMTIAVRVGNDTDMFNWRFKRSATSGKLSLR